MLSRTRSLNYCREIARVLTAPCLKSGHTRSKLVKRKPHRCGSVVFCLRFGLFWLRFQVSSFLVYGKRYSANSRKTNGAITASKYWNFLQTPPPPQQQHNNNNIIIIIYNNNNIIITATTTRTRTKARTTTTIHTRTFSPYWLIHWFVDLLFHCFIEWLFYWFTYSLVNLIDWLVDGLIDWLVGWLVSWLIHCLFASWIHWFLDSSVHWFIALYCTHSFVRWFTHLFGFV